MSRSSELLKLNVVHRRSELKPSGELVALCGLNIESAAKIEESFEDRPMIGTLEIDHASTWETARNSAIRNFTKQVAILWPLSKTRPMKLAATTICP
jgi:hypothetical protein